MLYIHIGRKVMVNENKIEKISSIVLYILGTVLVIDGVLIHFFNMGIRLNTFTGKPLTL